MSQANAMMEKGTTDLDKAEALKEEALDDAMRSFLATVAGIYGIEYEQMHMSEEAEVAEALRAVANKYVRYNK